MGMMTKLLTAGAFASAMTAGAAQAATFNYEGVGGNPQCAGVFGLPAGQINVNEGASVQASFNDGDAGGTLCFDLNNTSAVASVVTIAVATVNQFKTLWGFTGGITLNSNVGGVIWSLGEGEFGAQDFSFEIAAGSTVLFDWQWGAAYDNAEFGGPEFDFVVSASPIPVPAAGFLLIGALGGLAALRRRKTA